MTIKEIRKMNNLSQRELARMIGVTQAAINKWERQEVKISEENQRKIERIFGLKEEKRRITSYDIGR